MDLPFIIIIGTFGMLTMVSFIIVFILFHQKKAITHKNEMQIIETIYQKQLLTATLQSEIKERERIAKNIHDDIGALLTVLRINLLETSLNKNDKTIGERLAPQNLKLLEEAILRLRGVSEDLMPPTLVKFGFLKALEELCGYVNSTGIVTTCSLPENTSFTLSLQNELQLYRIMQELINNTIKHACAKRIIIDLSLENDLYKFKIRHNGKGITSEEVTELSKLDKGLGLKSIQSRAQSILAKIDYQKPSEAEAFIEVAVPNAMKEEMVSAN